MLSYETKIKKTMNVISSLAMEYRRLHKESETHLNGRRSSRRIAEDTAPLLHFLVEVGRVERGVRRAVVLLHLGVRTRVARVHRKDSVGPLLRALVDLAQST